MNFKEIRVLIDNGKEEFCFRNGSVNQFQDTDTLMIKHDFIKDKENEFAVKYDTFLISGNFTIEKIK